MGDFSGPLFEYYTNFFKMIWSQREHIGKENPNILVHVFLKAVRLVSLSHLYKELDELNKQLIQLITIIWKNHRKKCLCLGRELMRSLQELFKLNDLKFISKDLSEIDPETNMEIYQGLLNNKYTDPNFTPESLVQLQIPPFMEQYTTFILSTATKNNFNKHLNWMFERMKIQPNSLTESLIVDYIRYIIISAEDNTNDYYPNNEKIQRWLILGWLLKYIKNDVYKTQAKQALFFEWLYYDGDEEKFKYFEPCWLMIVNSIPKYKEMSEELLDFLFLYAREFDSPSTKCEEKIVKVFELIKRRHLTSLDMILESDSLNNYLKYKIKSMLKSFGVGGNGAVGSVKDDAGQQQYNIDLTAGNGSLSSAQKPGQKIVSKEGGGSAMDIEEISGGSALMKPGGTGDGGVQGQGQGGSKMMEEKLNSMATPDFVEIEHHCGGVSIFDKEKPYRLNSRGIILEKIGLTLSDFIQDSSRYSELCKKTSFGNLSLLLNEIFHQGLDIASQTYSPLILEQLTQDQQLGETYNLIKALFEQELKEELNLRGCINIEQLFSRLIARNFDFDHEQYFLKGVSFFLFTKVARLFSENFSYYSLMEKLLGNIFKKNPIVFIEFQLFLYILKTKEQGEVYDEIYKMRGVFQTLQYEKLSEIFIRSMSHVDDSTKLINDTLKFLYLQTKSSQFITLTIFFSDLVSNESPVNAQACILFLIKVLNVNIACKFEMENLDNQSQLFSQQFQPVMNKCLNGSGNIQANFWNFHRIMTQNYTKTNIIEETITNVASLMNGKVGMNLDTRSYMNFLYNFRNFFQSIFFLCEDEVFFFLLTKLESFD